MITKTVKETIREYDKEGKLIRETIKETTESNDKEYITWTPPNTIVTPLKYPYDINCNNSITTASNNLSSVCSCYADDLK